MEHPVSQRIKIIMERESNGKPVDFAKKLDNIPYQIIARLYKPDARSGKYPTPSTDLILDIINKFINYDSNWLLTGEGEMLKSEEKENFISSNMISTHNVQETENWKVKYENLQEKYTALLEQHTDLLQNKLREMFDHHDKSSKAV